MNPNASSFDSSWFRAALGQFATGVTVITARDRDQHDEARLAGLTATSFNSLSLDPPLILWSLDNRAGSLPLFEASSHYAINVLSSEQIELARRFSSRTVFGNQRFDGLTWREGLGGAPLLQGCCAWFECSNLSRHQAGDHLIFIGQVERCAFEPREPLLFQAGGFKTVSDLSG